MSANPSVLAARHIGQDFPWFSSAQIKWGIRIQNPRCNACFPRSTSNIDFNIFVRTQASQYYQNLVVIHRFDWILISAQKYSFFLPRQSQTVHFTFPCIPHFKTHPLLSEAPLPEWLQARSGTRHICIFVFLFFCTVINIIFLTILFLKLSSSSSSSSPSSPSSQPRSFSEGFRGLWISWKREPHVC